MSEDKYLLSAIDSNSERALSSRYPGNMETNVFFQHAYNYHPGTYADTGIIGNDERSSEYGLDMGDKSRFWINPDVIAIGCSFTQMGDLPYSFN